ncbi:SpoIIE family protein phosphatase [Paracrocinitomix mangrovi]|uniref:PP2C family protein-serine/threonine phosphatase n=1 Tax=Paracrocinitomix mangrovi TaxID=2862509 RepID=UPI001C8DF2D0|nr:SpoIIE family protein phosphatase [Paracrocinitomix mangrovi]UKN02933.1 SpoIIE family protein phosphatase [Paracrocinitomix mangrovi]
MKYTLLLLAMFGLAFNCMAQEKDSLASKFESIVYFIDYPAITSKAKCDSIIRTSRSNWAGYTDEESDYFASLIEEKSKKVKNKESKYFWLNLLAGFQSVRQNVGGANMVYLECLDIATQIGDYKKKDVVYMALSNLYYENGLYDLVIETCKNRIGNGEESSDSSLLIQSYKFAGWFYTNIGQQEEFRNYQDSAVFYNKIVYENAPEGDNSVFGEAAIIYSFSLARSGKREEALILTKHCANEVFSENPNYKARFLEQVVLNYSALEERDSALFYLDEMIKHSNGLKPIEGAQKFQLPDGQLTTITNQPYALLTYQKLGMDQKSVDLIEYIRSIDSLNIHSYYDLMFDKMAADAYLNLGLYKKASETYNNYIEKKEKAHKEEISSLRDAGVGYANAQINMEQKRAKEIENQQRLLAEQEAQNKRNIIIFFSVGSFGLILFLALMIKRFKDSQKQKQIIEIQKQEVEKHRNKIIDSIRYAKHIQNSILPNDNNIKEHLPGFSKFYLPKDIVSGDFYWFYHENNISYLVLSDCTGHGVPGAFMSLIGFNLLKDIIVEQKESQLSKVLEKMDEGVIQFLKQHNEHASDDGMDMSIVRIDHIKNELTFSSANQSLYVKKGEIVELKSVFRSIGGYVKKRSRLPHFNEEKISLEGVEAIFMSSDGFEDQFGGEHNEKLGKTRFVEILAKVDNPSSKTIENAFAEWKGDNPQLDDITVLSLFFKS